VFSYISAFNYTYFLILLKLGHVITRIYVHLNVSLFDVLFDCTHFELFKVEQYGILLM